MNLCTSQGNKPNYSYLLRLLAYYTSGFCRSILGGLGKLVTNCKNNGFVPETMAFTDLFATDPLSFTFQPLRSEKGSDKVYLSYWTNSKHEKQWTLCICISLNKTILDDLDLWEDSDFWKIHKSSDTTKHARKVSKFKLNNQEKDYKCYEML